MPTGILETLLYAAMPPGMVLLLVWVAAKFRFKSHQAWAMPFPPGGRWRAPVAICLVTLLFGVGLPGYLAEVARDEAHALAQQQFAQVAVQVELAIQTRFADMRHPLDLVRAAVAANPQLTPAGFARLPVLEAAMAQVPGLDDLAFVPAARSVSGGRVLGANQVTPFADDAASQQAAEQSTLNGDAVMSRPHEIHSHGHTFLGLTYFLPIYQDLTVPVSLAQRERTLRGWAVVTVRLDALLAAMQIQDRHYVHFRLYAQPETPSSGVLYDSEATIDQAREEIPPPSRNTDLNAVAQPLLWELLVADNLFYLQCVPTAEFQAAHQSTGPQQIALIGSSLGVLIALVLWLLLVGRARAMAAALEAKAALVVEKFRTEEILAGANVGTWETNHVTGESHCSARWSEMLGEPLRAVPLDVDAFLWDRVHPDDKVRLANLEALCAHNGSEAYSCELRLRHADGRWMWVLRRARVISRLADGRVEWIGGIHTDISNYKAVELNLRATESFLDRAGRIAHVGGWQIDLRTDDVIFSAEALAIFGMDPDCQPIRSELHKLFSEADSERLNDAVAHAIEMGTGWDLELTFVDSIGATRWVRQFGEVEFDDTGAVRLVGALQDITRDKKAQLEVARSGAILRGAIDALNEAFVMFDADDRLVFCNDKYRTLYSGSADLLTTGARFEDILRSAAARGVFPEAGSDMEAYLVARLAQFHAGNTSMEQALSGGRWLKVIERRMADGHTVGFRVDITEIKNATARAESISLALAEERRRLRAILEGTNVGTWEWNVQTGKLICNEQYAALLGYTPAQFAEGGYAFLTGLLHPEDALLAEQKMQDHLRGDSALFDQEMRLRHADGRWVWLLARAKLVHQAADGQPLWVYGTHMDINERKSTEYSLAETTAMLQNVLDSATQVGIICMGQDRLIKVFNKGAENLLGYSAAELAGRKTFTRFFDPAELAGLRESMELMLGHTPSSREVFDHIGAISGRQEWTLIRKDGTHFTAHLISSPMRNLQGEVNGHVAIVYDISQQKEYEASLRKAMLMAEQSSVAKSQFLANMSHEIRTPMNAVLGMLQLLHRTLLNARQRDYTAKAEWAARSLLGLLNDILDFSKMDAGKMQLDPQPFLLEELLADVSVILSSNLSNKPVDLVFDIDPRIPPELIADALRLKQVLINLGGNAVKFTEAGEVVVRWTLLWHQGDRVRVRVSVEDSGIGIAPENQARIFEAFTQAESNTTRRFGGTGLGLVISTRLVRLMGGELSLSSAEGRGSVFSCVLEFPVVTTLAVAAPQYAARLPLAPSGPMQMLLVDDNVHARRGAVTAMRSLGWQVVEAESGVQALSILEASLGSGAVPFHAVFADWQMPGMDGLTLMGRIRGLFAGKVSPRIILLSRHNRETLSRSSVGAQEMPDGFLVKPLSAGMFAQALALTQLPSEEAAVNTQQDDGGALARPCGALQGMRILLVEDNPINRQVASELLEGVGAGVVWAENGLLGLQALAEADPVKPFDVVLMDLQMPVMDGLTAVRRIRENPLHRDLPVIAMTANAMVGDREACLAAGMNDHVGKPFHLQNLVDTLVAHTQWQVDGAPADTMSRGAPDDGAPWPAWIDVSGALRRMGGNRSLLGRALHNYCTDAAGLSDRMLTALGESQYPVLQRELHTLKGIAATLGLGQVAERSAEAEHVVRDGGHGALPALLNDLLVLVQSQVPKLSEVVAQLGGVVTVSPITTATAVDANHTAVLPDLTELLALLDASDMRALEVHSVWRQSVPALLAGSVEPLDTAMSALDFELAAKIGRDLLAQSKRITALNE